MANMKRAYEVKTGLPGEIFVLKAVGTEELGRPFNFEVNLLSTEEIDLEKLLGKSVTLKVQGDDGNCVRKFNGVACEVETVGMRGGYYETQVNLRPWFWILNRVSDNKVFQEKKVTDIISDVFKANGFSDFMDKTSETYRKRDYCVQYGETTFEFISRLMEEEGIYYYFEHSDDKHVMTLVDGKSQHPDSGFSGGQSKLVFRPAGDAFPGLEHIQQFRLRHSLQTEKVVLNSYDYEKPKAELKKESKSNEKHAHSDLERYEYGQLWPEAQDGDHLTRARLTEHSAKYKVVEGVSNASGIGSGFVLEMSEHPSKAQNGKYLVAKTTISFRNNDIENYFGEEDPYYSCRFSAIPSSRKYHIQRKTRKGLVRGPQTAVVVGPSKEEIWTDKYGRVKVQFHWDRLGKKDEKSSCWIRVATTWAGNVWGSISIPRIGQEVIVDFLEGDPDQPIITGSVYNDQQMPPFALPDNKTQSGIRTRSSKDGSTKTFNELRFEDKKDSEEIYFHAETNFKRVVENDDFLVVGASKKDKGDQTIDIHNDRTVTLAEGNDSLTIEKGNREDVIKKGNDTLKVDSGNQTIKVKKKISIEAGDELHIKVGMSSLTMKKNGDITIKGKNIKTDGKGKITFKAIQDFSAEGMNAKVTGKIGAEVKGVNSKVEGSAMLDLKGGGMAKLKGGVTMIG